ncbi:coxsackievirus and adenovirus receptor-like [Oreochromis aureus]|uniref:coxsackievirus and adenovirus receptor-like n=1 Tax=Oreochromis aureus TaxID=47969 RepID=UPI001954A366|nr:coxsackievirus and adenovirus receptor-like [Oreochromis aureus]
MFAVITSLCSTLMFAVFVSADQEIITAESGQNVTLTCRASNNIIAVNWSRADLGTKYVLFYRDERFFPDDQHPSFKNRVDLQDRQMKDGDVSLILKNVTINDTGTYECRVAQKEPNQEISSLKLISSIYLHVDPPGHTGPSAGVIVGVIIGLIVAARFFIYRHIKNRNLI